MTHIMGYLTSIADTARSPAQKKLKPVIAIASLLFLCSLLPFTAPGQTTVTIIYAERGSVTRIEGERVRKLIGNVEIALNNSTLYCDSVYQFLDKSELRAFGNIEINTEEENIWADTLYYYTDVDFSRLRGRVIIETDTTTLFGNKVDYRFSTKTGHFTDQVRLEDQRGILRANSGFYYREADSAVFRGAVQVSDTTQYLEGDSLFSNRKSRFYKIYGDIYANDRENNVKLRSDYLEADSTGRRLLKGNAWLQRFAGPDTTGTPPDSAQSDSAQTDTTHIRAQTILSLRNKTTEDTTTVINAYRDVRIWSKNFSAVADTVQYNSDTETFELWSEAIAWHKTIQLTGPYIKVTLENDEIDRLDAYPKPFTVQQDTSINRLNQIKGDTLIAQFEDGNLQQIHVQPNSRLLYFDKNQEGNPDGAVDISAPSTILYFKNGDLVELKQTGSSDGSYLPESEQTSEKKLEGFAWNPEMRPLKPDSTMQRRFKAIPDEYPFKLPRRYLEHLKEKNINK